MGRVINAHSVTLYPVSACLDCAFTSRGQYGLNAVRAHLGENRDHRVSAEFVRRYTYEWSER